MTPDTAALRRDHYDYDCDGHCDDCGERHPCTVRALCDAAEAVERLTALVNAKQSWIDGAKVDLDGYADDQAEYEVAIRALTAERDASRTAHAALVAGIETGLRESACAECDHDRCATYRSAASWVRDYAALDRHTPTTGATS